jgi:WD40 domain-containing protein
VWDAASGQELLTLKGHTTGVISVSFSPEGLRIVSGSWDGTLKVWDAAGGQELLTLKGHAGEVRSVGFSPNGTRIISGSHDGTIKIWDGTPQPWNERGDEHNQPPPVSAKPAAVSPPPDHAPLPEPARAAESESASQPVRHGMAGRPVVNAEFSGFSLAVLVVAGLIALLALTCRRPPAGR